MGVEPVTYYTAICDHCRTNVFDGHDFTAWSDEGCVLDVVRDGSDTVLNDGTIICNDCAYPYWKLLDGEAWDALHDQEPEAVKRFRVWLAEHPATPASDKKQGAS